MALGILLLGELQINFLGRFTDFFDKVNYTIPSGISESYANETISYKAKENNLISFSVEYKYNSLINRKIIIYTDNSETKDYLKRYYNIREGNYNSILSGKTEISFESLSKYKTDNTKAVYIIGNKNDEISFWSEISDNYSSSRIYYGQKNNEGLNDAVTVWTVVGAVILVLTLYDAFSRRRETFLRIILGEKRISLWLKNVFEDSLIFSVEFITLIFALKRLTASDYRIDISIRAFAVILVMNSLILLLMFSGNYKKVLSNTKYTANLLVANYLVKATTAVILVLSIGVLIPVVENVVEYSKQSVLTDKYDNYYFTDLEYSDASSDDFSSFKDELVATAELNNSFYSAYKDKTFILCEFTALTDDRYPALVANHAAAEYLETCIPELAEVDFSKDYYILIPKNIDKIISDNLNTSDVITDAFSFYLGMQGVDFDDINYQEISYSSAEIVYFDEMFDSMSSTVDSPVIFLDCKGPIYADPSFSQSILYDINKEDFNNFSEEKSMQNEISRVTKLGDVRNYYTDTYNAELLFSACETIMWAVLEVLVISIIFRMEYSVNAVELSIKKVFGYSFLRRNGFLILMSLSSVVISFALGVAAIKMYNISSIGNMLLAGLAALIIDIIVLTINAAHFENRNIPRILKGEIADK